ncbi:SCO family protein [Rhodobacteraceae bacterium W635]|uniref:SCO family protein n=1 Tax=Nioella halotolerans TaxID=2303578 RepID=UPI000E3E06FF|nr:SCO family protein [Rhodobacteraceae bacterium W635]
MKRIYAISALALTAALLGGIGLSILLGRESQGEDQFAECRASRVAGGPGDIGGPFELVSETGETVTDADVITQPSLLYFGYTFCPDVCPLDNARNAIAVEILEERGRMVTPIFISIDPERDTPEVLADFTDNMHPRMIGLTGSVEQTTAASQAYRTYFNVQEEGDDGFYLVDHSTFTYLVLPEHGFVEFFRRDTSPEEMADRVACFADAAS